MGAALFRRRYPWPPWAVESGEAAAARASPTPGLSCRWPLLLPAGILVEETEAGIGMSFPWGSMLGWAALALSPSVLPWFPPEAC